MKDIDPGNKGLSIAQMQKDSPFCSRMVGVQQAFAGERQQKIKLLKLHSCRQIERPPNSSELPNLDPSAHLPPQEVVG